MAPADGDTRRLDVLNLRDHVEQRVREDMLSGLYQHGERLI
jgi:hypothetical protein